MTPLRDSWSVQPRQAGAATILPDGCRDLICIEASGHPPRWLLSPLQTSAKTVHMQPGIRMTGFRLHAAVTAPDAEAMACRLAGHAPDPAHIGPLIAENTRLTPNTREALACLARAPSVAQGARDLGVRMRSLQRLMLRDTGQSPTFWLQLARIRHTARLVTRQSLAEAAHAAGYADQAHMSRAFRRWFAVSPAAFRTRPDLVAQVFSRAYG